MKIIYGIVINNRFYSDNMEVKVKTDDGLYCIDVESEEYTESIKPADYYEFQNWIKQSKKVRYITGLTFKDGIIPLNSLRKDLPRFPIKVKGMISEEWEAVKVIQIIPKNIFYYIKTYYNEFSTILYQLKKNFEKGKSLSELDNVQGLFPEMKILYNLHCFERLKLEEKLKKIKEKEYKKTTEGRIKVILEESGAKLISYSTINGMGYEIKWSSEGYILNSLVDNNFRVIEAGYCISGYDKIMTLPSLTKLFKDHVEDGEYIHKTRV
jgi:hypothetical protein